MRRLFVIGLFLALLPSLVMATAIDVYEGVTMSGQCVTFARAYAQQKHGAYIPPIGTYHADYSAYWIYKDERLWPSGMTRVANNGNLPKHGDVIVWDAWDTGSGKWGHVAIVDSATDRDHITVAETNWERYEKGDIRTFSFNSGAGRYVLGWFTKNADPPPVVNNVVSESSLAANNGLAPVSRTLG